MRFRFFVDPGPILVFVNDGSSIGSLSPGTIVDDIVIIKSKVATVARDEILLEVFIGKNTLPTLPH